LALHSYHDSYTHFPAGYIDGNTDPNSTPDNDVGPGWGWATMILPFIEQDPLYRKIDLTQPMAATTAPPGRVPNADLSKQALASYICPSDSLLQPTFDIYDSTYTTPIATVASSNYTGCNGWVECFNGAGGNYQGGAGEDGLNGALGIAGRGFFWRNSNSRIGDVTDGTSNTIMGGERSANHSPVTWTGAVAGGRCPAWMADQPPIPYTLPPGVPGGSYDNADFGEAFVLSHGNATHKPSADSPLYDPDTFYSMHTPTGANYLFGDGSVHYLTVNIDPYTYQYMCTIAGGEVLPSDWQQ
jgi:prepilin-type processing-associated H-X9-DG protein